MHTIKFVLSIFFLFIGFIYLYNTNAVMKINLYARQFLFNDAYVLLYRKKIGVLFILLSIIFLYMAGIHFLNK
jgi:hypothetical protein